MRLTAQELECKIQRCRRQEVIAIALGYFDESDWFRAAERVYRERLEVARRKGYWEGECEESEDI